MIKKKTIYYEAPNNSSFVIQDINNLKRDFDVVFEYLPWSKKNYIIINIIRQFYFIFKNFKKIDIIICSFAGYHSILPALLSKIKTIPFFIILNGTESVAIKELKYGSLLRYPLKYVILFSLKWATELWPVSKYLIKGESNFHKGQPLKYGLKESFNKFNKPHFVIPNGIDINYWKCERDEKSYHELNFITVVSGDSQYYLKGVDLILEVALILPNVGFTIVGIENSKYKVNAQNIQFIKKVNKDNLLNLYSQHNVYLQLSSFEGFGVALVEAMSCGLIPIGSNVNAIPDIISNSGYIVRTKSKEALLETIRNLRTLSAVEKWELGKLSRDRVVNNYTIYNRIQLINSRINKVN